MDPYFFFVKQQHNNRSSLDEMLKYNELYSSISKPFFRDNSQFCTCQTKLGRTKSSKSTRKNQGWQIHEGKLTFSEECLDSYL